MDRPPSRAALSLAAAILGFLAVLAAAQPRVAPGRESRRLQMVDLITQQDERVRRLKADLDRLETRIEDLRGERRGDRVERLRKDAEELALRAGAARLRGPGITVTLDDSSASRSPTGNPDDLIVHERDIQTVVNALWAAGAEAVAINGERLSSASAVRCAGNTLLLHGSVHSPPYEIRAIGDPHALTVSVERQPGMRRLLDAAATFGLGFDVKPGGVVLPAPAGVPSISRAVPVS